MADIRDQLNRCENAVRAGQLSSAASILSAIPAKEIPRDLFVRAANLCRRTGKVTLGLRILTPVIHPKTASIKPASDLEIAEYAVLLQRAGGVLEALQLLESLGKSAPVEVPLYRAYCHFSRWNYAPAIPELDAYLASDLPDYARIVGEVNLASALIAARDDKRAFTILESLLSRTENAHRLRGNCLEMKAQLEIRAGRLDSASRHLDQALQILTSGWDRLFAHKWQSFITAKQTGNIEPLMKVKQQAAELQHFETQRDVDLLLLLVQFNEAKFNHLYFGSPLEGYRAKLVDSFGRIPSCSHYVHGSTNVEPMDFTKAGKLNHLLRILSRDLYRPVTLGALFGELFPTEYFDIFHSPDRIHQLIRRSRRHLDDLNADASITSNKGSFKLELGPKAAVVLNLNESPSDSNETWWQHLQTKFTPGTTFTAKEARAHLNLSEGQFRRLAIWAQDRHYLQTGRAGPATIYEIDPRGRAA